MHVWSATDHCRIRNGPFIDRKADLSRDGFRGESASGLCTGQIPPARLQSHWRGAIGDEKASFGRPVKDSTQACGYFRVYWRLAGRAPTGEGENVKQREQIKPSVLKTSMECIGANMMTGTMT
jgi:hypothetical protein